MWIQHPVRLALAIAAVYLCLAGTYIVLSGDIATAAASDKEELSAIERWKGLGFVLITGALLFACALLTLRRLLGDARTIARHRDALLVAERRAIAGSMAATISHDCANILTGIGFNAQLLEERVRADEDTHALSRHILTGVDRLLVLASRLKNADPTHPLAHARTLDLSALVAEEVGFLQQHPDLVDVRLELFAAEPVLIGVHEDVLRQALDNLILNAAQAAPRGSGRVEVRVTAQPGGAVVAVHDNGPGVPQELRARIFEARFTTRQRGSGLGLSSVEACAGAHGGAVHVGESPLGGAKFELVLRDPPRARADGAEFFDRCSMFTAVVAQPSAPRAH